MKELKNFVSKRWEGFLDNAIYDFVRYLLPLLISFISTWILSIQPKVQAWLANLNTLVIVAIILMFVGFLALAWFLISALLGLIKFVTKRVTKERSIKNSEYDDSTTATTEKELDSIGVKLLELIEEGRKLFAEGQQSATQNHISEWWRRAITWDREKVAPFVEKHFGRLAKEDYLDPTGIEIKDYTEFGFEQNKKVAILATRLSRARKLLDEIK